MSVEDRHVVEELLEAVQSAGGDDGTDKDAGDFMIIENGQEVKNEIEKVKSDFKDQTLMLCRELDSLWVLLKDFMRLACPTLICLVALLVTRFVVAKLYQPFVLSSLLGCAVATILVYLAPFMVSFNRYRRIRQSRVREFSEFMKSRYTIQTEPDMADSDTQTSVSCFSAHSTDTEVETLRNPSSSSIGSNVSDGSNEGSSNPSSIEMIGGSQSTETDKTKTWEGAGACDVTNSCDCC